MDRELAEAIAERELRNQHRPMPWTKKDQEDEDRWTEHDRAHLGPYALCVNCFPFGRVR